MSAESLHEALHTPVPEQPHVSPAPGRRKAQSAPIDPSTAQLAKTQSFVIERLHRSVLKNAAYNPRHIGDEEKRKLKAGLKKQGLVEPLVWNKRTGNLVSGHQRLSQIDILEGTPNYLLDVSVIDVTEAREREINVLLNNTLAMGVFDMGMLGDMLKESEFDLEGAGLDSVDVHRLFGAEMLATRDDPLDELAQKIREHRDRYDEARKSKRQAMSEEYYLVVVFKDAPGASEFIEKYNLPDNRYQSALDIEAIIEGREPTHARSFEDAEAGDGGDAGGATAEASTGATQPA